MRIIPRQINDHIAINPVCFTASVTYWVCLAHFIGVKNMLTNIEEPIYTIAVMAAVLVVWILVVQYSRYQSNIKEKKGTEAEASARQFAFIPYAVIPVIFAGIVGFVALLATDMIIAHGKLAGAEESIGACVAIAFVLYCLADKFIIRQVGKAVYFDTVIDKVVEQAEQFPVASEDDELIKKVKLLQELGLLK